MNNLIKIAIAVALIMGVFLYVKNMGFKEATDQLNVSDAIVLNQADAANNVVQPIILTNDHIIERNTHEIKEVIHEVPETGLNPISRARLERVREQQSISQSSDNTTN